jgi:uncharacterized membrane-anchored protein
MKHFHIPTIDGKYWAALMAASVFGANTGDFVSEQLGLGNFAGLPVLALALVVLFVVEKWDRWKHPAYFWTTIVLVRTAATNLGDISADNFHVARPLTIAGLVFVMGITGVLWARYNRAHKVDTAKGLATLPVYWWTMLLAGTLGTVVGDFCSYNLPSLLAGKGLETHWVPGAGGPDGPTGFNLDNLWATLACGVPVALLLFFGRKPGRVTQLAYYWTTVVFIRSAGTAAGDFFSHGPLGLPLSLALSGIVFVAAILFYPSTKKEPQALVVPS